MKGFTRLLAASVVLAAALGGFVLLNDSNGDRPLDPALAFAYPGSAQRLEAAYLEWKERHEQEGADRLLSLRLGWSKAYSSEFTGASGRATIDLDERSLRIDVVGLEDPEDFEVWLVQNVPGPGRTAQPEPGDPTILAGALRSERRKGVLEADLADRLEDFRVDQVVVAEKGGDPTRSGLLFGTPTLFQRLYLRARSGGPSPAELPFAFLVAAGADLFFNETFAGNGRTCGTCHPADNNLTIEPAFIAGLPPDDPLFVAEFVPALARNFEKPTLMRKLGLILENVDGFDDLENRFVMRGVPHTLALSTSLTAPPGAPDGTTIPPEERTGWSGDGSPGSGTLREFANGAIRQHFTRTLAREPGADFRFATEAELDALEAFQLSLGREADPVDVEAIRFRSEIVSRGRDVFVTQDAQGGLVAAGKCAACHANAGATVNFLPGGLNFNFDTGVEDLPDHPANLVDAANNPRDGGFGSEPNPRGGFGNGTFNTPTLIEAADTGPFFHDNAIETIEEAVGFYNSAAFNESPASQVLADPTTGVAIRLEPTQVVAVAAFLRVMNALENVRQSTEFAERAEGARHPRAVAASLALARAEAKDAQEVLDGGGLHPLAVRHLRDARAFLKKAAATHGRATRDARIRSAICALERARDDMIEGPIPFGRPGERRLP